MSAICPTCHVPAEPLAGERLYCTRCDTVYPVRRRELVPDRERRDLD